ncbi:MAG: PAS domain S-box protein [Candidatus Velthaea sp.]
MHGIRDGEVDAVVVEGPQGTQVFTLQSAEEPYRILAERMHEGAATLTSDGIILFCNKRLAEMVGRPAERLTGSPFTSVLRAQDRQSFRKLARFALTQDARAESRLFHADGTVLPVQLSLSAIPLQDAEDGICLVATDLSDQKRAEELLDAIFENIPYGIFLKDAEHLRYLRINRTGERYFGTSRDDIIGKADLDLYPLTEAASYQATDRATLRDGALDVPEERISTRAGERWQHTRKVRLLNENGKPAYVLRISEDITERKQLEEARSRLAAIVESSDDAIMSKSFEGIITACNSGAERLFGIVAATAIGTSMYDLIPESCRDAEAQICERLKRGDRVMPFETLRKRSDGSEVAVLLTLSPIRSTAGQCIGISETGRDISEMKSLIEAKALAQAANEAAEAVKDRLRLELSRERTMAQTFQETALPAALPQIAGIAFDAIYRAANNDFRLGGDWYDAVALADGRILLSIGDVTGTGREAAMVMASMRQVIRGVAHLYAEPIAVLDAADQNLKVEHPESFVTAFVGILDPIELTLTYAFAGHPRPLLRRSDGSIEEVIGEPGLPLGLRERNEAPASVIDMPLGTDLILYTDGLTEWNRDLAAGEALLKRAAAALPRKNPARALVAAMLGTVRNKTVTEVERKGDDIAVLVVQLLAKAQLPAAAGYGPTVRWTFDVNDADEAHAARHEFVDVLRARGLSPDDRFRAELIFGELLGNVVRYAAGEIDVTLDMRGRTPILHTMDNGEGFALHPRLPVDPFSERGRGLFLIDAIARNFNVTRRRGGGAHARVALAGRFNRAGQRARPQVPSVRLDEPAAWEAAIPRSECAT